MYRNPAILLSLVLTILVAGRAQGKQYDAAPTKQAVFSDEASETAGVALLFDISGMEEGEGLQITRAFLEWDLSGVGSESTSDYSIYEATETWSEASVGGGSIPATAEAALDHTMITPLDHERSSGSFLRLDVSGIVRTWEAGGTNRGVLIVTPNLSSEALAGQGQTPTLKVLYRFMKD